MSRFVTVDNSKNFAKANFLKKERLKMNFKIQDIVFPLLNSL